MKRSLFGLTLWTGQQSTHKVNAAQYFYNFIIKLGTLLAQKRKEIIFFSCAGLVEHVTVLVGIAVDGTAVGGVIHQPFYQCSGRTIWGIPGKNYMNNFNVSFNLKF